MLQLYCTLLFLIFYKFLLLHHLKNVQFFPSQLLYLLSPLDVAQAQQDIDAEHSAKIAEREKALSGRQKLADLGLDEAEINALVGAAPEEVQPVTDPA